MEKAFRIVIQRLRDKKLDKNILCSSYWAKLLNIEKNFNEGVLIANDQAWRFFFDNAQWVFVNNIVTKSDLQDWFSRDELIRNNFYLDDEVDLNDTRAVLFDCTGKVAGHSHIVAFGGSTNIRAFDTSCINIFGGKVKAKDCFVFAFNNTIVEIEGYGKAEVFDEVTVSANGFSYVIFGDNSEFDPEPGPMVKFVQS